MTKDMVLWLFSEDFEEWYEALDEDDKSLIDGEINLQLVAARFVASNHCGLFHSGVARRH